MHHTLKVWKEELDKALAKFYYTPTCDFCHNKLFMSLDEAEIVLFEPKEVECEHYEFERDDEGNVKSAKIVKAKEVRSSDPNKDIFKFKCPYCGHIQEITRKELYDLRVSYYGDNNIRFALDDVETERALAFMKKHAHKEELKSQGKLAFTTLGQQFTYEFTPGGLGSGVVIKCNICGESENITNIDNW